ncbi:MAG: GPR endopeptidase [Clostridia bacterium]|nr:GPR endopeptidase [Clostridia bacterium]
MEMNSIFEKFGIVTDLAVEAHSLVRGDAQTEIPGVIESKEKFDIAEVTTIIIENPAAGSLMGKAPGTYITIDTPGLRENDPPLHDKISEILASKIETLLKNLNIADDAEILLVGLGNWSATPDALGPRVISHVMVTRHLHKYLPQSLGPGFRPVSALSPGVMGITGIETAEIIRGTVEKVKPSCVIAIDALAATNVDRICSTIQIADTGINPGSGVGNQRMGIDINTLGIPVIAIGIPTVVNAAIIIFEAFNALKKEIPGFARQIQEPTLNQIADKLLAPFGGDLSVTPKEIDTLIDNAALCIATALNQSLHKAVGKENAHLFLQ